MRIIFAEGTMFPNWKAKEAITKTIQNKCEKTQSLQNADFVIRCFAERGGRGVSIKVRRYSAQSDIFTYNSGKTLEEAAENAVASIVEKVNERDQ